MKTFLTNLFLSHWERKLISAILSVIIWLMINHSLTSYQLFNNVAVRIINIPLGMTVEGIQPNGILTERISLTVTGNKTYLEEITANDVEIILDATDKSGEWLVTITRKNLASLNPEINLSKAISKVSPIRFPIRLTRLVTEKIPVIVTYPVGEAPRDYQFIDVWPYHLFLTVSGPEALVKQLKVKGLNLTFNLNNISHTILDSLQSSSKSDEISFLVPDEWKQLSIPALSDRPLEVDDPQAKYLRIDFIRSELHPLAKSLPISLFYPPEYSLTLNPETHHLSTSGIIHQFRGLNMIRKSLYAKGASRLFVELVQDMLEISIILAPKSEKQYLDWSIQFINPKSLEDRYVAMLLSDISQEQTEAISHKKWEEYLRNRFRNYMNRFQLYKSNDSPFDLKIEIQGDAIELKEAL